MLVCLLCVNGYIKVTSAYDRYYTPVEYTSFLSKLEGKDLQEIIDYTNGKIDVASENPEENGCYNGYLYYDTIEIAGQFMEYPKYLTSIESNTENMATVFIWGRRDTFSYRNIWNPVQFLQGKEILGTYISVNLFGYSVSLKISGCIVIGVLLAICLLGSISIFSHSCNLQYKSIRLKRHMFSRFHDHGRFWHACHRILILQKELVIVFAAVGMCQTFSRSYNNEDIY